MSQTVFTLPGVLYCRDVNMVADEKNRYAARDKSDKFQEAGFVPEWFPFKMAADEIHHFLHVIL